MKSEDISKENWEVLLDELYPIEEDSSLNKPFTYTPITKADLEAFRNHNYETISLLKEVYQDIEYTQENRRKLYNHMLNKLNQLFLLLEKGDLHVENEIDEVLNHLNALQALPH